MQKAFSSPLKLKQRSAASTRRRSPAMDPAAAGGRSARSPALHRFPRTCRPRAGDGARPRGASTTATRSRVWRDATDARRTRAADRGAARLREMKAKMLGPVLARRLGVAMAEPFVPDHARLGDVDCRRRSPSTRLRSAPQGGAPRRRRRRDRAPALTATAGRPGRRGGARGRRVLRGAQQSLELALYDIRLHDEAARSSKDAPRAQHRGAGYGSSTTSTTPARSRCRRRRRRRRSSSRRCRSRRARSRASPT